MCDNEVRYNNYNNDITIKKEIIISHNIDFRGCATEEQCTTSGGLYNGQQFSSSGDNTTSLPGGLLINTYCCLAQYVSQNECD